MDGKTKSKSEEKITSFSVVRKKTPFQKHREEEEAKKRREDEEAARLYEEFVESFKVDDAPGSKAFVRGGTINPNDKYKVDNEGTGSKEGSSSSKKPGSRYVPSFMPPGLAAIVNKGKDSERKEDEKPRERDRPKVRNIDNFMEELKKEQELRERRNQERSKDGRQKDTALSSSSRFDELPEEIDPNDKLLGSFDDGDPQTTNLYVGNLAPQVDENFLLRTFGRFGPIASVKIMWPRTEEERRRQRNCGFVAFMRRGDAQAAKDEMQGVVVYDNELKIGWGKAVALPAQALPAPPPGQMAIRSKEGGTVAWSGPGAPPTPIATNQVAELVVTPNIPDIEVISPEDEHLRHIIDTMAMYVLDDGCAFEQAIMERSRGNPLFNFLFDLASKEHTYYVWRLYSFAQGETLQRWRTEPFIMIAGSGRWMPPPLPQHSLHKSVEDEKASVMTFAAGRSRERALTDSQRDEFEDMLRALTLERELIKDAMGFALDNADAAGEVVEVLAESLTLKETPIPTKVARLMLVSDILHNSSAPVKNASAYRTRLEATLPDILESFNELYRNITGRITAEALKERVLKVLQVWADRFLFSDAYVNGLRATFLRPGNSGVAPFHSICGDAPPVKVVDKTVEQIADLSEIPDTTQDAALAIGEGAAARELSSLPLAELERRCRHNGLSTRGGKEVMVARLLSLEEAEKQRNQELEDNRVENGYSATNRSLATKDGVHKGRVEAQWNSDDKRLKSDEFNKHNMRRHRMVDGVWSQEGNSTSTKSEFPFSLIRNPQAEPIKTDPVLPVSKWTQEDDGSDEDRRGTRGLGLTYSSSESEDIFGDTEKAGPQETCVDSFSVMNDLGLDEEQRKKKRRLEIVVMEYRESLEERGIKNLDEIENKVSLFRKKREAEMGFVDGRVGRAARGDAGADKYVSRPSERASSEKRDRRDERKDASSSKKRSRSKSHSRSPSLVKDRLSKDREKGREREREKDERDHQWERDADTELRDREIEKSSSRDRHDHSRERDRDRDRAHDRGREKRVGIWS